MWWSKPVRVLIGSNTTYVVATNERAAELMLGTEWPGSESALHRKARVAILKSMDRPDDPASARAARRAFEAAAREAGILKE